MTSFGANKIINMSFMPTFKIQGQIYHQIGSILPTNENDAKFLQIYFIGNEENEINTRCSIINNVEKDIITRLQRLFHNKNRVIQLFKYALQKLPIKNYQIVIRADQPPIGQHKGRYNEPSSNEVAIVMINGQSNSRDIIVQRKNDQLERVSETHSLYDALQYPIIFWDGDSGYDFSLKRTNGKKVRNRISTFEL